MKQNTGFSTSSIPCSRLRDLNVLVGILTGKMCRCLAIQPVCFVAESAGLVIVITKTYKNSKLRAGRELEVGTTAAAAAAAGDGGDGGGGCDGDGGDGGGCFGVGAMVGVVVFRRCCWALKFR